MTTAVTEPNQTAVSLPSSEVVWTEAEWRAFEQQTREAALNAASEETAWNFVVRASRRVMRRYTTSFFIVSRFLPRLKRDQVEVIYATVRYPDEVVDTFPLSSDERTQRLNDWRNAYEVALNCNNLQESLRAEVPCFLAGFAEVVRRADIPPEHYRSFLKAMEMDIAPRRFDTMDALIQSYVYGSATVVGYFLAYVYGAQKPDDFNRTLNAAQDLGIALQLTNFLRDVGEDQHRDRVYLPRDLLDAEGLTAADARDPAHQEGIVRVVKAMAQEADRYYRRAAENLDAFAADSRIAIQACIDVYGRLNRRIIENERGLGYRESVSLREKWQVLPASKYWKIPLAYLLS